MKKIFVSTLIVGSILSANIFTSTLVYANENNFLEIMSETKEIKIVNIPDNNLKKVLNKSLNKSENSDLTVKDLESIEYLYGIAENISNIEGLEYCKNLKILSLQNNDNSKKENFNTITDLSPLKYLKNLVVLDLRNNKISDLSPLENLTNLESLRLSGNNISNISPLNKLESLTTLTLSYNEITDISTISNLKNLTHLALYNNKIEDISSLKENTKLQNLSLGFNKIKDISVLSNLKNLYDLSLEENNIKSKSLSNLHKLSNINLKNNKIEDISPLETCNDFFEKLILDGNRISDISSLSKKEIIVCSINNQTITIKDWKVSDNNSFEIKLPNDNLDIKIDNISENGTFIDNSIKWTNISPKSKLSFEFKQDIDNDIHSIFYSGTVRFKR
uniref:Internalin A (LPXTG motif) n=1 Tax=Clostridium perfringens TaxID=1502 RepID=K9MF22_CLOPF|nr:leucine-rich repeat domain-containing protein [Clostridium perfringens]AFV15083.1 Internalin A (LPXTG motif) [Clostridium perfringens]